MPTQIVVSLVPTAATAVPPPHTGPAVYAAFLKAVRAVDPELSTVLHDRPRYKPFTLSPIVDERGRAPSEPGQPARIVVGLLVDAYAAPVLAALHSAAGHQIAQTRYRTVDVAVHALSYAELATGADPDATTWAFDLLTPVGFATGRGDGARRQRPWPDAERVFGNLSRRWDAFAGEVALPASAATAVADHLEVVDAQLRMATHLVEPGQHNPEHRFRRGTVGSVTYQLAEATGVPGDARRAVDALATFATYAGFGDRTAMGMGHVRRRLSPPPQR
ncbi:CRISPR system precrRNA processing endoribonuclease RAMP protein Cas6 [Solwaraspora sp. WMMD406]|uniref:CRISPR system precrRNA processing endoribonuclease RAMP protein Cas6 n=1 Tax=Solwaraspora sp. WMMD406 TaxID=3016095 RepID=UPI002418125A|nr:CRISPR system precrRNA processing endoribonuclease RAMP protein Cas6 [Solwaraspora sp. WMMD406]MDG4765246.1 CRISPR system precrRNA processing endoribonuclease RAMP protein Cas6 [Solwaraspora sp. WMMD406]